MPRNFRVATSRATSNAPLGTQIESTASDSSSARSSDETSHSPQSQARLRDAGLRPSDTHTTRTPRETRQAPTAAPISPGCKRVTVIGFRNSHHDTEAARPVAFRLRKQLNQKVNEECH